MKMIEEHLRNMVSRHQRDWEDRLHVFQLTYWVSTHETTSITPANMVFTWALGLPCDLQTCWKGLYIITWINMVYTIQWHPRSKIMGPRGGKSVEGCSRA